MAGITRTKEETEEEEEDEENKKVVEKTEACYTLPISLPRLRHLIIVSLHFYCSMF